MSPPGHEGKVEAYLWSTLDPRARCSVCTQVSQVAATKLRLQGVCKSSRRNERSTMPRSQQLSALSHGPPTRFSSPLQQGLCYTPRNIPLGPSVPLCKGKKTLRLFRAHGLYTCGEFTRNTANGCPINYLSPLPPPSAILLKHPVTPVCTPQQGRPVLDTRGTSTQHGGV